MSRQDTAGYSMIDHQLDPLWEVMVDWLDNAGLIPEGVRGPEHRPGGTAYIARVQVAAELAETLECTAQELRRVARGGYL